MMAETSSYEITVDRDTCMGSGVCTVYAPNTFELDDDAKSTVCNRTGDPLDRIQTAAQACPTRAITVTLT
jgi:ferredoxin